jgi:uncharacterized lipoprotein YbaY
MRTVTGNIRLPHDAPVGTAAQTLIRVRDVTFPDLPAVVVGEQTLPNVGVAPDKEVSFALTMDDVDVNRLFNLDVHVDMDGSNTFTPGDLITTDLVPVLTNGAGDAVTVTVSRIG